MEREGANAACKCLPSPPIVASITCIPRSQWRYCRAGWLIPWPRENTPCFPPRGETQNQEHETTPARPMPWSPPRRRERVRYRLFRVLKFQGWGAPRGKSVGRPSASLPSADPFPRRSHFISWFQGKGSFVPPFGEDTCDLRIRDRGIARLEGMRFARGVQKKVL